MKTNRISRIFVPPYNLRREFVPLRYFRSGVAGIVRVHSNFSGRFAKTREHITTWTIVLGEEIKDDLSFPEFLSHVGISEGDCPVNLHCLKYILTTHHPEANHALTKSGQNWFILNGVWIDVSWNHSQAGWSLSVFDHGGKPQLRKGCRVFFQPPKVR